MQAFKNKYFLKIIDNFFAFLLCAWKSPMIVRKYEIYKNVFEPR